MLAEAFHAAFTLAGDRVAAAYLHASAGTLVGVVLLAALSEALGQSAVLFVNRVPPRRFLAALGSATAVSLLTALLWMAGVTLLVRTVLPHQGDPGFAEVARLVALAYVPRLLGVLVFTPYLGQAIGFLTSIWSLLLAAVGLRVLFGMRPGHAALAVGLSWLVMEALRRGFGHPLVALNRALTRRLAGSDLTLDADALYRVMRPELEPDEDAAEGADTGGADMEGADADAADANAANADGAHADGESDRGGG